MWRECWSKGAKRKQCGGGVDCGVLGTRFRQIVARPTHGVCGSRTRAVAKLAGYRWLARLPSLHGIMLEKDSPREELGEDAA